MHRTDRLRSSEVLLNPASGRDGGGGRREGAPAPRGRRSGRAPAGSGDARTRSRARAPWPASTFCPPSSSSSARSPSNWRSGQAGIRKRAGRRSARPSARLKVRLSTGSGAVALTAPSDPGVGDGADDQAHEVVAVDPAHRSGGRRRTVRQARTRTGPASAPACRPRVRAPGRCADGPGERRCRRPARPPPPTRRRVHGRSRAGLPTRRAARRRAGRTSRSRSR